MPLSERGVELTHDTGRFMYHHAGRVPRLLADDELDGQFLATCPVAAPEPVHETRAQVLLSERRAHSCSVDNRQPFGASTARRTHVGHAPNGMNCGTAHVSIVVGVVDSFCSLPCAPPSAKPATTRSCWNSSRSGSMECSP
jgi:hypothetical protein